MSKTTTTNLARMLQVLGDPTRLSIFNLLMQGVQCNCEIGGNLKLPINLISHHLKVLRDAGLVDAERDPVDARWVYYAVYQPALNRLREELSAFLDPGRIKPRQPSCGPRVIPREAVRVRVR